MRPRLLFFAQFAAYSAPGRFAATFLAAQYGLSASQIGTVLSAPVLGSLVAVPLGGHFADRWTDGHRRVILLSNVLSCVFIQLLALRVPEQVRFLYVAVFYTLALALRSPASPAMDALALDYLASDTTGYEHGKTASAQDRQRLYGRERLWGAVSWGLASIVVGICLDVYGQNCIFFINAITNLFLFSLLAEALTSCFRKPRSARPVDLGDSSSMRLTPTDLSEEEKVVLVPDEHKHDARTSQPASEHAAVDSYSPAADEAQHGVAKQSASDFWLCVCSCPYFIVFLATVACVRVGTELVETLIFLFFVNDLKASNFLCGVSVVVTVLFEIPIFYVGDSILRRYNNVTLMLMAILGYLFRVAVYTLVRPGQGWLVLLVEPLHGVTYSFVKMATVQQMADLAPTGLEATAQSMAEVFGTIGGIVGTFGGGVIMERYGSVAAYRTAAILVGFSGVLLQLASVRFHPDKTKIGADVLRDEDSWTVRTLPAEPL